MLHSHKDFDLPDASLPPSQLNTYLKTVLPQDVFAYAMPLEVSDEFRDGLLAKGVELRVADGAVLKRQCEYLAGRYCALESLNQLQQVTGIELMSKQVGTGESREPIWPQGVIGAITHSNQYAMSIVAQSQRDYLGIGLDIEEVMTDALAKDIRAQILSEQELMLYRKWESLNSEGFDYKNFVTLVFSAKESIFKAIFPTRGEYFGFEACELIELDLITQSLTFRIVATLGHNWPADKKLTVRYFPLFANAKEETGKLSWLTLAFL